MVATLAAAATAALLSIGCSSAADQGEGTATAQDEIINCGPGQDCCKPRLHCPTNYHCGTYPDGCGDVIDCGACSASQTCGSAHTCVASTPTPVCGFDGLAFAMSHGGYYDDPGGHVSGHLSAPLSDTSGSPYHIAQSAASCPMSNATDQMSVMQRTLIQSYGCSSPFYFQAYNSTPNMANGTYVNSQGVVCTAGVSPWSCWGDKANGYPQLCPYSTSLQNFVASYTSDLMGWNPATSAYQVSDALPHFAGGADDPTRQPPIPRTFPTATTFHGAAPAAPTVNGVTYVWVLPWMDPHACGGGGCMCGI
jgi:hypothetical protein